MLFSLPNECCFTSDDVVVFNVALTFSGNFLCNNFPLHYCEQHYCKQPGQSEIYGLIAVALSLLKRNQCLTRET